MTIQELIDLAAKNQNVVLLSFAVAPVLTILVRVFHSRGRGAFSPHKYIYSFITYLAVIPGIIASVLLAYALFFTRTNLLEVNAVIYFLPIVSMIVTLFIISRIVSFNQLPGFDRLRGLMFMIAVSFAAVLFIQKMRIWVMFHGSLLWLILLGVGIFVVLKLGAHKLFARKNN